MSSEIAKVKSSFTSMQVHFSDIWLETCINWCKSETLTPNYTLKDLQSQVYEQWLILDLRDIEVAALPPDLSSQKHYILNGNFCLQMMQIIDISKPKLWQLQKIRNSNALTKSTQQDADVAGTGKRMLQITLTDGVQQVEAMEYRPVQCLSINLRPGCKFRILGPVVVRRGRLMLEPQNVKVLGGEVEELLVSNAAENVLARQLKLPENPNPVVIEEKLLAVEREEKGEGFVTNFKVPKPQSPPPSKDSKTIKSSKNISEEERMMEEEIESLMEAEADYNRQQPRLSQSRTPDLFEDVDFDNINFNISKSSTSTQKPVQKSTKTNVNVFRCRTSPQRPVQEDLSHSLDDDDDIFDNIDIDAHLEKIEKENFSAPSIVTIAKILENKKKCNWGTVKIKAKFKSVVEKLTVTDNEYKLVIKVEDSSGDLVVRVHSDIIADFAECSPANIISLKSNVLGKDEAAVEKMMNAIIKVKDKLLELDAVMTVQVVKDEIPVITKIL